MSTATRTHTALLAESRSTDRWRVFVALMNTTDAWPEQVFTGLEVPTRAARTAALALLGYEPVEGAEWEWSEDSDDAQVHLLASLPVRERTGGAA
ncbi:DUF6303 family protein [Streptomyces sp. NPDC058620]|uniref:DUF6303 family protein n=1 Tax=Streptomyces sp. NPDC058620 TaxID=3346560 RepID=UPI00364D706A